MGRGGGQGEVGRYSLKPYTQARERQGGDGTHGGSCTRSGHPYQVGEALQGLGQHRRRYFRDTNTGCRMDEAPGISAVSAIAKTCFAVQSRRA